MRKKLLSICTIAVLSVTMLAGCGDNAVETSTELTEAEEIEAETEETEVSAKTADVEEVEEESVVEVVVPVHTHNYALTASTVGTSCTNAGIDTYTCNCGDSYTVANNNYGTHTWTTETYSETIHHDAVEHYQRGYVCSCGTFWPDNGDLSHAEGCGYVTSGRVITDSPAYDEVVNHSRTYCTSCGAQQ